MTTDDRLDFAVGLESAVWRALVDGDRAADLAALADHFIGVYPSGRSDRAGHAGQLADGPSVVDYAIDDPFVMVLAEDCLLLTYEATYRRTDAGPVERMYVSSIWQRLDDGWLNVFSQDTPIAHGSA